MLGASSATLPHGESHKVICKIFSPAWKLPRGIDLVGHPRLETVRNFLLHLEFRKKLRPELYMQSSRMVLRDRWENK